MTNDSFFLDMVNKLIQDEYGDTDFNGLWMLVASWEDVIVVGDSVSIQSGYSLSLILSF